MAEIDLVSADLLRPLTNQLETMGSQPHSLMEKAGLSPLVLERFGFLVPQVAAWRFAEIAARYTGDEHFCYDCITKQAHQTSQAVASLPIGKDQTAFEALKEFVKTADRATTGTRFWLEINNRDIWIFRKSALEPSTADWQIELFATAVFTKAIANILGRNWRPKKVAINQRTTPGAIPPAWSDTQILTNKNANGIAIDIRETVNAANFAIVNRHAEPQNLVTDRVELTARSLRNAILPFAMNWDSHIGIVAEAFGLSTRSFQRRLAEYGLTYSAILDEARHYRSIEMLCDQTISITEISFELGYQYPNHFSRAFKRHVGVSPTTYRNMINRGETAPMSQRDTGSIL